MLNAYYFWKVSNWCYRHHLKVFAKLITLLIFLLYNSKIPAKCSIGKGTRFGYGGMGVVLHEKTVIGTHCFIAQQVTVGGGNNRRPGIPVIGDNVTIAKGALVFGKIKIGNNVVIGANAVVGIDCPDNSVVAGVPARILRIQTLPLNNKPID